MPRVKANGAEINYEESGSGTPVFLSAGGLAGNLEGYRPLASGLARRYRVIIYDRRFGGQSRSPLVVQTWDQVCQDLIGLMDALRISKAVSGGGSFGAAISLASAVRYPDRLTAIFPSALAGGPVTEYYLTKQLYESAQLALQQGMKAVVSPPSGPYAAQIEANPAFCESLLHMTPEEYARIMKETIYALFGHGFLTMGVSAHELKGIRMPTLIMPGTDDIHPRHVAEEAHRLVPGSRWADIPSRQQDPEKYVQTVLQFLGEVGV